MQAEAIDFIRFTTISQEMIKKMSVAKLIVPDTYNEDGYPIDSGLLDQRLGVIDPGLVCKTCGARAKTCPGHFGHLELVRPVIHSEFSKILYMIMHATCFECHRILLDEKHIAKLREASLSEVFSPVAAFSLREKCGKIEETFRSKCAPLWGTGSPGNTPATGRWTFFVVCCLRRTLK